ncbi:MAG TPA: hypothetical protein VLT33_30135 [Labilithrix sp.]|nr:hypothetical protein [Labilithrix sp.]
MRVLFILASAALVLGACSDAGGPSPIRRRASSEATGGAEAQQSDGTPGGGANAPTPTPAPSSDPSPGTPDAGSTTPSPTPPPPAPAGSCGNPKCFAAFGTGGCKATDGAGASVAMGCQDGACACVSGGQTTATFEGTVNSAADASQLFLSNCDCQ